MDKVLVAMSGGVDSSVCAAILVSQGYECIGVTMQMLDTQSSQSDIRDAAKVCEKLGIEHKVLDERQWFKQLVIDEFVHGYEGGTTPNPCILCNRELKFRRLWDYAQSLGCEYLATGHYAQIKKDEQGIAHVYRGANPLKDQSYVVWPVAQSTLQHILLPLGSIESKEQVRKLAVDFGFEIAHKSDSQDICFIPDGHYQKFLEEYTGKAPEPGPIMDEFGEIVGVHKGLTSYTLGQRKGVGVAAQRKIYVTGKDAKTNTLFVGDNALLFNNHYYARDVNWLSGKTPDEPVRAQVCSTYQGFLFDALITPLEEGRVHIQTQKEMRAVCPGQSTVAYIGDEVIFGGIIELPETPPLTAMQQFMLEDRLDF